MADERTRLTLEEVQRAREQCREDLEVEVEVVMEDIARVLSRLTCLRARRDELYATLQDLKPRRRRAKKGGVTL